nr:unnamed protein product [Callosobruchus chinensis]
MSKDEDNGSSDIESTQTPTFEDLNSTQKKGEKIIHILKKMEQTCKSIRLCKNSQNRNCYKFKAHVRQNNNIFQIIWNEMDWAQRKVFVSSNVIKEKKVRRDENSRSHNTYMYLFK